MEAEHDQFSIVPAFTVIQLTALQFWPRQVHTCPSTPTAPPKPPTPRQPHTCPAARRAMGAAADGGSTALPVPAVC